MTTWTVTTNAAPDTAREATGIIEWAAADSNGGASASTWRVDSLGIASGVVRNLRAAGHTAVARKDVPDGARTALERLERIGAARKARADADAALKAVLASVDEPAAMREALDAGVALVEIARRAGCDRQWVRQVLYPKPGKPRAAP